jgi:predicted transcriptional regulator
MLAMCDVTLVMCDVTTMSRPKQAPITLKKRMLDKKLNVKQLAAKIGHARTTVSRAINHGANAGVLSKVKEVLNA